MHNLVKKFCGLEIILQKTAYIEIKDILKYKIKKTSIIIEALLSNLIGI